MSGKIIPRDREIHLDDKSNEICDDEDAVISESSPTRNGGVYNLTANTVFGGNNSKNNENDHVSPSDPLFDRANINDADFIEMLIKENQELKALQQKHQRQILMLNSRIETLESSTSSESPSNNLSKKLSNPKDETSSCFSEQRSIEEPKNDDIPQRSERRNHLNKTLPMAPSSTSISSIVSHPHTIDSSSILSEGTKSNLASESSEMLSSPIDTTSGSGIMDRAVNTGGIGATTAASSVKMAAVYQNKLIKNSSTSSIGSGSGSAGSTYKSRLKLPATLQAQGQGQQSQAQQISKRTLDSSNGSQSKSISTPQLPSLLVMNSITTPQQLQHSSRNSYKRSSSTYADSPQGDSVTPQTPRQQNKYYHDSPPIVTPYANFQTNEKPIFKSPERPSSTADGHQQHHHHLDVGSKSIGGFLSRRRRGNLTTETIHSGIGSSSTNELPRSPTKNVHTPATQVILVFQSLSDRKSIPNSPESLAVNSRHDLHGTDVHSYISSPLPNSFQHNLSSPQRSFLTDTESSKGGSESYTKNSNRSQTLGTFSVLNNSTKEEDYSKLFIKPEDFGTIMVSAISTLSLGKNEEPHCILGAVDRSTSKEMWKVKKNYIQLLALDNDIRPSLGCFGLPQLPDKSSFYSNIPTKVDMRRITIQDYFNSIFVMPHVPHLVLYALCLFLSCDIVNPLDDFRSGSAKEGYLIRKYKGFGTSWKVRWCQVDGPVLEVYDSPGGTLVELLQLQGVSIGRQSNDSVADERGYRHAFLIMESTKSTKLSSSKHFFCAESDTDRDDWITVLLQYATTPGGGDSSSSSYLEQGGTCSSMQTPTSKYDGGGGVDELDYGGYTQGSRHNNNRGTSTPTSTYEEALVADSSMLTTNTTGTGSSTGMTTMDESKERKQTSNSSKIRSLFPFGKASRNHTSDSVSATGGGDDTLVPSDGPPLNNSHEIDYYLKQMQLDDQMAKAIFGREIDYGYNLSSGVFYNRSIPSVLSRCLIYMNRTGAIYEEGIFRLSGSASTIRQLKDKFNKEYDVDLFQTSLKPDIHTVAGLFKTYLRELPSPIFGLKAYSKLNSLAHSGKSDRDIAIEYQHYINTTSDIEKLNYDVCYVIFRFLREVIAQCRNNKMNTRNMCIVFVPTLNVSVEVLIPFLVDFECIFEGGVPIPDSQREILDVNIPLF